MALFFAAVALRLVKQGPMLQSLPPHSAPGNWRNSTFSVSILSTKSHVLIKNCCMYSYFILLDSVALPRRVNHKFDLFSFLKIIFIGRFSTTRLTHCNSADGWTD